MVEELKTNQNKEKSLSEKVNESYAFLEDIKEGMIKKKKIKLPRKARVRKGKLRKGWIGIINIGENGNISGEKQKLADSSLKTKDGIYHATDGREILFWEGKYPVILQPSWKETPLNIRKVEGELNETYGQKYVQARMMKDAIRIKGKGNFSGLIWIVGIGVVGYILYKLFTGGF